MNHRDFERIWHFQVSLGSMFLRVEFPTHLGAPSRASGAGLWGALGCAPLAEVGECGARSGRACVRSSNGRARVPGVCLQMGPRGSHRRASGALLGAVNGRWWVCISSHTSGHHRRILLASACPPPSRRVVVTTITRRRREGRLAALRTEPPPSNGARLPAELKHITKRRKRNQQGCP